MSTLTSKLRQTTFSRLGHRALVAALLALPLAAIGCGSEAAGERELDPERVLSEAPAADQKDGSLAALGFDTALRSDGGSMMYLAGHVPLSIRDAAQVRDFVRDHLASAYNLSAGTDFGILSDQLDASGQRFVRLQQLTNGVPVPQGQLSVHVGADGALLAVLGQLVAQVQAQQPGLTDGQKRVQAAIAQLAQDGQVTIHGAVETAIFVPKGGDAQLALRATVEYLATASAGGGRALEVVYIRPADGRVLARYSQIHDALNRQIYDLGRTCIQSGRELPGRSLFGEGGTSSDASASAVYQGLGDTYAFFKSLFGRDSYDGRGGKLSASVHATFSGGTSCSPNNAVWMGAPYNQMAYGDGDGRLLTDLAKALDVTGHELTHAITGSTSALVYQDESGALNEAMSDIHGIAVLAWKRAGSQAQPPASGSRFLVDDHTWRVGEAAAGPQLAGGALRFMNNPTADGYSRDFYPERLPAGGDDNGGVHGNSGIANLAFYLLSQGGQHPRQKTTTQVNGIGFEKALRVFYTANTTLLDAHASFQSARVATAQAAQSLYGACSPEWQNTHRAWDAVGVPGAWTPCASQGGGSSMPAPTSPTLSEVKPNNSFQTAMAISQSGTTVQGQLASLSDNGFFKMSLAAGATLSVRLDVPATADYDLYVYNSNGTLIAKSENGQGLAETLSVRNSSSSAFTRYVRVVPYSGTVGAASSYKLRLSW